MGCFVDAYRAVVERTAAGRTRVWRMLRVKRRGARDVIVIAIYYED